MIIGCLYTEQNVFIVDDEHADMLLDHMYASRYDAPPCELPYGTQRFYC